MAMRHPTPVDGYARQAIKVHMKAEKMPRLLGSVKRDGLEAGHTNSDDVRGRQIRRFFRPSQRFLSFG